MNIAMKISYDGSCFKGFQRQPGLKTVQGTLEIFLSKLLKERININGSGRTDAGVHAIGQVVNFKIKDLKIPLKNFKIWLNNSLNGEIAIKDVWKVEEDFHARYSVLSKSYIYWIKQGNIEPWLRNYCWFWKGGELDMKIIKEGIEILKGEHDFRSFCIKPGKYQNTIRKIDDIKILNNKNGIFLLFKAKGFLRGMVRMLTSAIVHVACKKISINDIKDRLENPSHKGFPAKAPPNGLYLLEVIY